MEIESSVSSYISSISAAYKQTYSKTSKVDSQISISSEESITSDPLAYYKDLCSKYPHISFRLEDYATGANVSGCFLGYNNSMNQVGENFGEMGQCSIQIDVSVIKKMMQDQQYAENVHGWIQSFEQNYGSHATDVTSHGNSNFCFTIDDFGEGIQTGRLCANSSFSTEEEVKRMWANEDYQKSVGQLFEKQKADLIDIYLKMTENCILKMKELTSSEIIEKKEQAEDIAAITSKYNEEENADRKVVGFTTFPVAEHVKAGVFAFLPSESTSEDPIIQIEYKGSDGEKKIIDVHVNDIDVESASDMEMFAYLTYQGLIGNKIPNALNNYDAYQRMKFSDGDYYYHDYQNGESRFLDEKINTSEMIQRVLSWMKNINHPDAQMHARMCEDLLEMLNPVNDTLENYV
ncbi:hypothetical protein SAMN05421493_11735 [Pseudobutyrivibrio sp. 49]|uniref:DUF6033 family protein n=1 Tax=Pseudobutyrivibrio sp. 49 TaxID=1855344 RepID=UPI00089217DD|nr:DUF6033 family protein [Pseudobutyrivibrio sp. 49]SDI52933.1 hypothetical protein SAMN05421493_11735 [Pseudobutyrivibrio sp. 49]